MGTLATEIRDRLGLYSELEEYPLVSVVVLNRNGVEHLRRLMAGLIERTDYPRLEVIVVDNGSSDESLDFIRSVDAPFPISIVSNPHNESFSDANNQGAKLASGELLLLLNNDIEPIEPGWLRELIACLRMTRAGAVSATLINPDENSASGYRVQTRQIRLRGHSDRPTIDPTGGRRELFDEGFGDDIDSAFTIGACILIEPELFWQVGGFTHGYFYGGEDDDLCLKLRAQGMSVIYSGRSVLIHGNSSTRKGLVSGDNGFDEAGNTRLLWERWGPRVWREYQLDRLSGGHLWATPQQETPPDAPSREEVLALGFCLKAGGLAAEEVGPLEALEAELARRGHRCLVLREDSIDRWRGLSYDVAVCLRGPTRHMPVPGQLNVMWVVSRADLVSGIECKCYDLVVTGNEEQAARLREESQPTPVIALDGDRSTEGLIDAVLARAEQIDFPTRVELEPKPRAPLASARR